MGYTYSKKDKLKSQKTIERLFSEGKSLSVYPLKLIYLQTDFEDGSKVKTGVSVSKKNFNKAVNRNRIKRLLREAYRLNKHEYFNNISEPYALMILYLSKNGTDFEFVNTKMKQLLETFKNKVSQ